MFSPLVLFLSALLFSPYFITFIHCVVFSFSFPFVKIPFLFCFISSFFFFLSFLPFSSFPSCHISFIFLPHLSSFLIPDSYNFFPFNYFTLFSFIPSPLLPSLLIFFFFAFIPLFSFFLYSNLHSSSSFPFHLSHLPSSWYRSSFPSLFSHASLLSNISPSFLLHSLTTSSFTVLCILSLS